MAEFLLRALGYGLFWFCVFSISADEDRTYFDAIHDFNHAMYEGLNNWLDGK